MNARMTPKEEYNSVVIRASVAIFYSDEEKSCNTPQ